MKRILTLIALVLALSAPAWAQNTAATPKINKKNLVIKEWKTDPKSGAKSLDHITTFNADGKKIEEIEYNAYGQKWRKRFEYGADGKCYNYDPKGKLVSIKVYEYLTEDA